MNFGDESTCAARQRLDISGDDMMKQLDELHLLDEAEREAQQVAETMHFDSDVDRRKFVFFSLGTGAATTFGFGAKALSQTAGGPPGGAAAGGAGGARVEQSPVPPVPLDNMEEMSWSVGPIKRNAEDAAMVFNAVHGGDPKDPSTVTMPFHFNSNINLASVRMGVRRPNGNPNPMFDAFGGKMKSLGAKPVELAARPAVAGSAGRIDQESAAAFDSYVQVKAKELDMDMATVMTTYGRAQVVVREAVRGERLRALRLPRVQSLLVQSLLVPARRQDAVLGQPAPAVVEAGGAAGAPPATPPVPLNDQPICTGIAAICITTISFCRWRTSIR